MLRLLVKMISMEIYLEMKVTMNEITIKKPFLSIFEDLRALTFRLENTNIFVFQAFFGFSNFLDHFCFFSIFQQ